MKTYKIGLYGDSSHVEIEMQLRPTEAKLLERVSNLLDDAIPDSHAAYMHGELIIDEVEG